MWSVDNYGLDIAINGHSMGLTASDYLHFYSFTLPTGYFTTGINKLDFTWQNVGGPGGLNVRFTTKQFRYAGLELGVVDQRTWVGNTSEFTVNIKNTSITPQTLTSASISGTPYATLLSTLPTVPLQPGEQAQLTYRLSVPASATGGETNSPVLTPVALNVVGNGTTFAENFQIQLYQMPATQIAVTVQDDATQLPIANALVALDNSATLYQTDSNGNVTLNVAPGARTVFAYATGHLSAQQTLILTNGALGTATLSLPQGQALAVSSVTATPLTPAQIQARGINLSDPSNFFIYDFVVKMRIGDFSASNVIIPAHPSAGSTITGSVDGGGYYSFYFPTGNPTVRVETWIIIEGDIRVLKQFWDATVFINNNTSMAINGVDATLTVPTGLSLPPLFGQAQPLTKTISTIPAMSQAQAEWTLRGDVAGQYQLSGTAIGTLALGGGNVPLSSTLSSNTITVVAPRLSVAFTTPDTVTAGQNFTLGIDITNNSSIDLDQVQVYLKTDRLVNCILAVGQSDTINLGSIAVDQTTHIDTTFTSLVTGRVLEVQTYISPSPEVSPDVSVVAQKVKTVADTVSTYTNTSVAVPVLSNDEGDTTLAISTLTQPTHGTVTTEGQQVIYTPAVGYIGMDYFTYTAQDTAGNVGTANVAVAVSSVPPTISGTSPGSSTVGASGFDLVIQGTGFDVTTVASWNGNSRTVTFVSPSQLKVTLLTSDLAAAGLGALMLTNPSAGSAVSSYAVYNVYRGAAVLSATLGTLTRDASGNILVPVSITNTGLSDAIKVGFSVATLKTGSGLLNVTSASSLGTPATIFIGTTQNYTLVFPKSSGSAGVAAVLQLTFGPAGGASQGRSQRVTFP